MSRMIVGFTAVVMAVLLPLSFRWAEALDHQKREAEYETELFVSRAETTGCFTEDDYLRLVMTRSRMGSGQTDISVERTVYTAAGNGTGEIVRASYLICEDEIMEILCSEGSFVLQSGDRIVVRR